MSMSSTKARLPFPRDRCPVCHSRLEEIIVPDFVTRTLEVHHGCRRCPFSALMYRGEKVPFRL